MFFSQFVTTTSIFGGKILWKKAVSQNGKNVAEHGPGTLDGYSSIVEMSILMQNIGLEALMATNMPSGLHDLFIFCFNPQRE